LLQLALVFGHFKLKLMDSIFCGHVRLLSCDMRSFSAGFLNKDCLLLPDK
jgi:hypothetical protein